MDEGEKCYGISRSMLKGGTNAGGMPCEENIQPTITANGCGAICYGIIKLKNNANPYSGCYETEISCTLDCNGANPNCEQGGILVVDKNERPEGDGMDTYQKVTGALCAAGHSKLGVQEAANGMYVVEEATNWDGTQKTGTLTTRNAGGWQRMPDKDNFQAVIEKKPDRKYILRRLTPTECARLQGFPDWWTDGAEGSDSNKYKMWGNGIALPCAADVLGRIAKELEEANG